ncbi:hypothetical protein [Xanthomonas sp. 10-10]|uniref:Uncharacterized protein n=1 Tax=Xanthomonas sp. 10-10 TaxID=3115848 RepID=A0AAU7P303_9XANT
MFDVDHWLSHTHRLGDWISTCSMDGHIHYFDGVCWQTLQTSAEDGLNAVFVASQGSIYAAALDGYIRLIESHRGQIVSAVGGKRLNALHGFASHCPYAVGDGPCSCSITNLLSLSGSLANPTNQALAEATCRLTPDHDSPAGSPSPAGCASARRVC